MRHSRLYGKSTLLLAGVAILAGEPVSALQRHTAIALYGNPKYGTDAQRLEFTRKGASKGGTVTLPAFGTFDTLNPYSLKGESLSLATDQRMWGIDALNETLMMGGNEYLYSPDEPQSAYCLICEFIEFEEDYRRVSFTLHPEARFHDGTPITADDVAYSFHLLTQDDAHPRFADIYRDVEGLTIDNHRKVTFKLKEGVNRQILFRLGELPVMSSSFWKSRKFGEALTMPPLLSGPYKVCRFKLGHTIDLCRVENFWSKNHFFYQDQFNFDTVRYEFFRDRTVAFEAFKSGKLTAWVEYIAKNWATAYDFPALKKGVVIKQQIPHQIPASYQFFVLNLRRAPFNNPDFRQAMTLAFDFEWTNKFLFNGAYKRANSYFPNSAFGAGSGAEHGAKNGVASDIESGATGIPSSSEKELLLSVGIPESHPMLSQTFSLPVTEGNGNPRQQLTAAMNLLKKSGYIFKEGALLDKTGHPVHVEFLVDHASMTRVVQPYIRNLKKLGIKASLRSIDESQYKSRMDKFDFDVAIASIPQGLIPSYELRLFFHSSQAAKQASYNYGGVQDTVVDTILERFSKVETLDDIKLLTSALDRVLLWNNYTIPQWYLGNHRIAYQKTLNHPDTLPPYSLGFSAWWKIP